METGNYSFKSRTQTSPIIKVMGVGGGGTNTVNYIHSIGVKDVEFVVCNTDYQHLQKSDVLNKIQLGPNTKQGLGAGGDPSNGEKAAMESKEEIIALLRENTKMIFITSGMGGGTGTGAAPYIASLIKDPENNLDILTVGIVTIPFRFEGEKKRQKALEGVHNMRQHCDVLLVILNDKILDVYKGVKMQEAFNCSNQILAMAVKSIAEIITVDYTQNMDFEDVKAVLVNSGTAVMGYSTAEGENRMIRVATEAITSPLLNNRSIKGAKSVLVSIISGEEDIFPEELDELMTYLQEQAGSDADLKFGTKIDTNLKPTEIRVTVIATGFDIDADDNLTPKKPIIAKEEPIPTPIEVAEEPVPFHPNVTAAAPVQMPAQPQPEPYQQPGAPMQPRFDPYTGKPLNQEGYRPGQEVHFGVESTIIKTGVIGSPDGVISEVKPTFLRQSPMDSFEYPNQMDSFEYPNQTKQEAAPKGDVQIIKQNGQKVLPMDPEEFEKRLALGEIKPKGLSENYENIRTDAASRFSKLQGISGLNTNAQLDRFEKEPAYLRKGNNLGNTGNPMADDQKKKLSNLQFDSDDQIVGGNKFFNSNQD